MKWPMRDLCCVKCDTRLDVTENVYSCPTCGSEFPVLFGVPLLSTDVRFERKATRPSQEFVGQFANFIGHGDRADVLGEIEDCFSLELSFGDLVLQTESEQFLNRLRSSGVNLSPPFPVDIEKKSNNNLSVKRAGLDEARKLALDWIVVPTEARPNQQFSVSVVVRNESDFWITSANRPPLRLSYFWERNNEKVEGLRTPFLIDIAPYRQMSMPILISAPQKKGTYTLSIMPILEEVAWLSERAISTTVVVTETGSDFFSVDWKRDPHWCGVENDHSRALELCRDWMKSLFDVPIPKVVELGGNFNPMVKHISCQGANVDIDAFGLMAFNIAHGRGVDAQLANIVANGMNLPFEDGSLDAIMMFATFHHFPDPVALLRHLKSKLNKKGIVFMMCEPIGHVFRETNAHEFIAELERGVYEQSFMPWEYREMLNAAGLRVSKVALDVGSLKLAASHA